MSAKPRLFLGILTLALVGFSTLNAIAGAQVPTQSNIVVVSAKLPALVQQRGIALQLFSNSGDGKCYLYIEQDGGKRLLALDVTNPARISVVGDVSLTAPAPFDFLQEIPGSGFLVRFRDNSGMAVIDVRKPRSPALTAFGVLLDAGSVEALGDSTLAMITGGHSDAHAMPRDYQVVDISNPAHSILLSTVKQVNAESTREETGTTFLLGSEGLTVIRRPAQEAQCALAESYSS